MSILSFKDFTEQESIREMAIAGHGDWLPADDRVYLKSNKQLNAEWQYVAEVNINGIQMTLYKMRTKLVYITGILNDKGLDTLFHIELNPRKDIEVLLKHKYANIVNVDGVMVKDTMRGNGIAKFMYKYLVQKLKYNILGDELQYHKARLTWASLSKMDDMLVDIVDSDTGEVIEHNIVIHHGTLDWDYDERIWGPFYTDGKKHIRLILTGV